MEFKLGIKSDPIEYRNTFTWLFRLMAEEGVTSLQLGSFFEMYQLPDAYFIRLKKEADDFGITIDSLFTAHRELGGFFREDPEWAQVARRNYERFIEIGALVGAKSVGSNPGAVPRDRMGLKADGLRCYMQHMKELMHFAKEKGIDWLTIEPMSCLAEPPTLPDEMKLMGDELTEYHQANPMSTSNVGYCTDIAHGYLNQNETDGFNHVELFKASLPWLYEIHLKNTDDRFNSTFGFQAANVQNGIVDVAHFRDILLESTKTIPVDTLGCYLEIGGPKLGRDYSDGQLDAQLRESLTYLKENFLQPTSLSEKPTAPVPEFFSDTTGRVAIAPSMMCVDPLNFETALRRVEALGADMLHMDVMDGHFVPNAPMGLAVIESLKDRTHLPIDVHLMVENNDFFVSLMEGWGVHQISVHTEACSHLDRTLARIREIGAKAGAALNPSTPLSTLDFILERIDYVLLMTVNPGFAGQKMTPASLKKIADCHAYLEARGYGHLPIQVDGNVSFENIPAMVAAGADNLVAGTSSIFNSADSWPNNIKRTRDAIAAGLRERTATSVA
ncbi:ribulose-phosphate 3-epimerase [Rubellicoccus peritrichatus]|uniref:Ribulose-phosphate 3-epimerase n=1 Tax=Rubellicoccus peritrichatus TaxID=3080537 RepID=A0AAQ3LE15_9BACT|nr:ribulose-phosphate 3-epimerase [Puniceicoccus sp. CR14]WOO42744.1 ribulose-phosphate 3-epimerase [Puniceicoccus sp. CR14]